MVLGLRTGQFANKRIAVIGMARTGRSVAAVLRRLGAEVILSDSRSANALGEDYELAGELGVGLVTEASPDEALAGASLVVTSPGVPRRAPVLEQAVRSGVPVLAEIEIAYRLARAPILAVTGTNGKSTTAVWLAAMLQESGFRAHVAGNISTDDTKRTLVDAAVEADEDDVIVAEISSFQLEWVERFRPKIGILTNVKRDHLDRHGSVAEYAACKARLFAAQRPDDTAIVNAVNVPARAIGLHLRSRVIWFDRGHCGHDEWACIRDNRLTVRIGGEEHRLAHVDELRVPGLHNQENALAASAAALVFGARPEAVTRALTEFAGLDHRMELVTEFGGVAFINSSMTTNVDSAIRVLETVGRPVILIAGGVSKNEDLTPLGAAIARYVSHAVLIGRAAPLIEAAAWAAGFDDVSRAASMADAVRLAVRRARPGDAVVLAPACASQDMFRNFEDRGRQFREAVSRYEAGGGVVGEEDP